MMFKLPVLGFALVTALTGTALAHEPHSTYGGPAGYHPAGQHSDRGRTGYGYGRAERGGHAQAPVDLRYADLNRDGWVSMQEALDSGRQVFYRNDRNNDHRLSRREAGHISRGDRNNDGRLSLREHQRAIRAQFASYDRNRDGYLARHELGLPGRGQRSAGWWR